MKFENIPFVTKWFTYLLSGTYSDTDTVSQFTKGKLSRTNNAVFEKIVFFGGGGGGGPTYNHKKLLQILYNSTGLKWAEVVLI